MSEPDRHTAFLHKAVYDTIRYGLNRYFPESATPDICEAVYRKYTTDRDRVGSCSTFFEAAFRKGGNLNLTGGEKEDVINQFHTILRNETWLWRHHEQKI